MVSTLMMLRRFARALRYAAREGDFLPVLGSGVALVVLGTIAFAIGEGWHVVDALYFAVSTLTTTGVSDPDLVLHERSMKVFAVLFQLVGIGVLVEILRRIGFGFVAAREAERRGDSRRG